MKLAFILYTVFPFLTFNESLFIRNDVHKLPLPLSKNELEKIINTNYDHSITTLAYKSRCETMMAEHVYLTTTKLAYFNKGKDKIKECIQKQPENLEIRYSTLLVQANIPSFLNYNDQINNDLNFLIDHNKKYSLQPEWKLNFIDNLQKAKKINEEQRTQLLNLKAAIK